MKKTLLILTAALGLSLSAYAVDNIIAPRVPLANMAITTESNLQTTVAALITGYQNIHITTSLGVPTGRVMEHAEDISVKVTDKYLPSELNERDCIIGYSSPSWYAKFKLLAVQNAGSCASFTLAENKSGEKLTITVVGTAYPKYQNFLAWCQSSKAKQVLEAQGFNLIPQKDNPMR
jgi:hypothetical protein